MPYLITEGGGENGSNPKVVVVCETLAALRPTLSQIALDRMQRGLPVETLRVWGSTGVRVVAKGVDFDDPDGVLVKAAGRDEVPEPRRDRPTAPRPRAMSRSKKTRS